MTEKLVKNVLIFSDSLLASLPIVVNENNGRYRFYEAVFTGSYVSNVVDINSLHWLLNHGSSNSNNKNNSNNVVKYDVVIICFGINDLGIGCSYEEVVGNLLKLHQTCRDAGIPKIVAMFLDNEKFCEFNRLYEEKSGDDVDFCEFFLTFNREVDLCSDNLHLSEIGKENLSNNLIHLLDDICM